jgi:hypothetical protein
MKHVWNKNYRSVALCAVLETEQVGVVVKLKFVFGKFSL